MSQPDQTQKLVGIEILRFLCAFGILCWHYQHFSYVSDGSITYVLQDQPFFGVLSLFYTYGYFGVKIFWFISGFIFFWKYADTIGQKVITFKKFAILRFSRLYPLHIVTLLFMAVMHFIYFAKFHSFFVCGANDWPHFVAQLFMASDWGFLDGASFNGPIWSVSLEVLAYIIFFTLTRFCGAGLIATFILFVLNLALLHHVHNDYMIIECLFYFYLGGVTMHVCRLLSRLPRRFQTILPILSLAGLALMCLGQVIHPIKPPYFIAAMCPVVLYSVLALFQTEKASVNRAATTLGNLTYSSYLLHLPFQIVVMYILQTLNIPVPFYNGWFFLVFISVTFTASYFCYRYFEMPAQDKIRDFFKARTVSPTHIVE